MVSRPPPRVPCLLIAGFAWSLVGAQQAEPEVVSFRCALALDAVIAELDTQSENPVTQQALERIDEDLGEFVCLRTDAETIYLRLQSPDLDVTEGRLTFKVDARTYRVLKTTFGP